jgi:hypothetical protein
VTNYLTPTRIEVRLEGKDVVHVVVVSEQFAGIPISKRFDLLSDLFVKNAPALLKDFTPVFQAWTTAEMGEIEADGNKGSQDNSDGRLRRVAKPLDL